MSELPQRGRRPPIKYLTWWKHNYNKRKVWTESESHICHFHDDSLVICCVVSVDGRPSTGWYLHGDRRGVV